MGSFYKQQLNDWVNTLEVRAKILFDIGGAQHPLKGRTASWGVEDYKIIDLEVPHVELQKPDLIQDLNQPLDRKEFKDYIGKVDWIYNLGVFDYIINPNIAMQTMYDLLCDGGQAWVEFPFVYPIHNPKDIDGLRYTEPAIRNLAEQTGFSVEQVWYRRPKPENRYLLQFYSLDGMRAADGVDHNVTGYLFRFKK